MKAHFDEQIPHEADLESGLPIGPLVAESEPARPPQRRVFEGRFCRLEPLDPTRHSEELFAASTPADAAARFLYLPDLPPTSVEEMSEWAATMAAKDDPLFFAVIDKRTGRTEGRQTLMRISPGDRSIEIGNIYWGPAIAGSAVATEANFLFAKYAFEELGYRRYEWKCNALNAPSRLAALRFGFQYEGHFRRATIVRGRSRDTSWYSMISEEWPALNDAYERWLAPENFDEQGVQRSRLSELTAAALSKLSG